MTTGKISIHALREEGDTTHEEGTSDETHFYPRPPRGGRHNSFTQNALQADISIHALREEGDSLGRVDSRGNTISIHALREEGDLPRLSAEWIQEDFYPRPPRGGRRAKCPGVELYNNISIHALREEGDGFFRCKHQFYNIFLSTPSARRATLAFFIDYHSFCNFYPRPPRGGRPCALPDRFQIILISIHALREEGDRQYSHLPHGNNAFLSTPSARRATPFGLPVPCCFAISIHALREEGDGNTRTYRMVTMHFYPRPPRGGRQLYVSLTYCLALFLSTPSARRATQCPNTSHDSSTYFYPRPPRGGRPFLKFFRCPGCCISIHALREEGDRMSRMVYK